ncbi:YraN family protein [Nocardioides sediminis]|uniref:YraN family protein n=1 Tax=Nocardioides sediminis TaxID=433648 RepID=UPI000D3251C6|nr:YraN family protein [Nocardioides sediminis]
MTTAHPPGPRPSPAPTPRQLLGAYGEELAARHLSRLGMTVLDRNWRCDIGEIDLVLRDGSTLVICEVKTRSSTAFGTPHEAVTGRKVARMRALAARWLHAHQVRPLDVRLDMVCVIRPRRGPVEIDHVPGLT